MEGHTPATPPVGYVTAEAFNKLQGQVAEVLTQITQMQKQQEDILSQHQNPPPSRNQGPGELPSQRDDSEEDEDESDYVPPHSRSRTVQSKSKLQRNKSLRKNEQQAHSYIHPSSYQTLESERYDAELRAIKVRLEEFEKGKRKKQGDSSARLRESPFVQEILEARVPKDFHLPKLKEYDGTGDPWQHVNKYRDLMQLHGLGDAIQCKAFSSTLTKAAHDWFSNLVPSSIACFSDLADAFTQQFIAARKRKRSSIHLVTIKQGENENLRRYIKRFSDAMLEMKEVSLDNATSALMNGTTNADLKHHLVTNPPETMDELMSTSEIYINAEELGVSRRVPKEGQERKHEQVQTSKKPGRDERKRGKTPPYRRFEQYTPLSAPHSEILLQVRKDGYLKRDPPQMKADPRKRDRTRYCDYHRDHGHATNDCIQLKNDIEKLVKDGRLRQYSKDTQQERKDGRRNNEGRRRDRSSEPEKVIHVITGGRDIPGRRTYQGNVNLVISSIEDDQRITFSKRDLEGLNSTCDDSLVIRAKIKEFQVRRILIDTGSSADILFLGCAEKLGIERKSLRPCASPLTGFTGHQAKVAGRIILPVTVGDDKERTQQVELDFIVVDADSAYNAIFGRPSLIALQAAVSPYYQSIKFPTEKGTGRARSDQEVAKTCYRISNKRAREAEAMTIETMDVRADHKEAWGSPAEEVERVQLLPDDQIKMVQIGASLGEHLRRSLISFLRKNADVFAWSAVDMPGVKRSTAQHDLQVDPSFTPIKQKRRNMSTEKMHAAEEEVQKLLKAGFIREVRYPQWLSNIVMVKKANGKWRMCVDFTNLNKACPKDSFPLPIIDQMVDAASGHEMISFMDAFSGYNQIKMKQEDEEKTSFITSLGTYCYKVMPFGLKNAGATYQRLMTKIFRHQISRNVEVYVDDMLVKSRRKEDHLQDLEETFKVLREHDMKLNPEKCAFGVNSGKFLGFMITKRGIEANPEKVDAITSLEEPKTVKDIQRLNGKLAALHRFLSKHAERSLLFFKVLRGAQKKGRVNWTPQCSDAFKDLKEFIVRLPLIAKPKMGEPLFLYLATGDETISSVLIREEGSMQYPVYFVSKILRGAELNYSQIEKLAYAIVVTARKLKSYFQAHPVTILSNYPLGKVLEKPECSGRLLPWSIELTEFALQYKPRPTIKGQVLADFIVESSFNPENKGKGTLVDPPPQKPSWNMYVDGASNKEGAGAGVVLHGPEGLKVRMAIKLGFNVTNNEAEYEAIVAGLKLADAVEVDVLTILTDSQLVAGQLNGEFGVKGERMAKYKAKAESLLKQIPKVMIVRIPRDENEEADTLAKGASMQNFIAEPDTLTQILTHASIDADEELLEITVEESWRDPIAAFLKEGVLPPDVKEAEKLKRKSVNYTLVGDILYKRSFTMMDGQPLLRCLGPSEADYVIREIHEGICGSHQAPEMLTRKAILQGYYWPTMAKDCKEHVMKCDACQRHARNQRKPAIEMQPITSPIPFAQWGMDLLGPFPQASRQRKFLIVVVDYFTKWVECKALAAIRERNIEDFIWKNIISRFGIPRSIVTDNGKQFDNKNFREFCAKYGIDLRFSAVAYPQCNGQAEVTNRTILNGILKKVEELGTSWAEELPSILFSYRTTYRTPTGETPFRLTYGTEALVPVEVGMPNLRMATYDQAKNDEALLCNLDLLEEIRGRAVDRMTKYKQKIAQYYNAKIKRKSLMQGDLVLRAVDASGKKTTNKGKLAANWEGPYRIKAIVRPGTYKLETTSGKEIPRAWNIQHLKKYYQ